MTIACGKCVVSCYGTFDVCLHLSPLLTKAWSQRSCIWPDNTIKLWVGSTCWLFSKSCMSLPFSVVCFAFFSICHLCKTGNNLIMLLLNVLFRLCNLFLLPKSWLSKIWLAMRINIKFLFQITFRIIFPVKEGSKWSVEARIKNFRAKYFFWSWLVSHLMDFLDGWVELLECSPVSLCDVIWCIHSFCVVWLLMWWLNHHRQFKCQCCQVVRWGQKNCNEG